MNASTRRSWNASSQPVDHLKNLEEIANVKIERDQASDLWALVVEPNRDSWGGFERIAFFGITDSELEGTVRKAWIQVSSQLTEASTDQLSEFVQSLDSSIPHTHDPAELGKRWIQTPVKDTWESPELFDHWKIERGRVTRFRGPVTLKVYGIAHQFFGPSGDFIPIESTESRLTPANNQRAIGQPCDVDQAFTACWRVIWFLSKWAVTLAIGAGIIVGVGYLLVHFLAGLIGAAVMLGIVVGFFVSD